MSDKHPYISTVNSIIKAFTHFRRSLPTSINSTVLKKLGIAPKNESYLINVLKFLSIIADDGSTTPEAKKTFTQHDDKAFEKQLAAMIEKSYSGLFSLQGESTWTLDNRSLITYFRETDQSTAIVGQRQAGTFQILTKLAGYGEVPTLRADSSNKKNSAKITKTKKELKQPPIKKDLPALPDSNIKNRDFGLTVRIEINLPSDGDKNTYDLIFKSIRDNLLG